MTQNDPQTENGREKWMIVVALAIMAIALVQAITPSSSDVYWDVDPRSQIADQGRLVFTTLTPTMLAVMQMAMLGLATVGLALHVRVSMRRRTLPNPPTIHLTNGSNLHIHDSYIAYTTINLSLWATALALLGMGYAAYHVMRGGPHVQPGAQWMTACAGALALFHLAQNDAVRRWLMASLIAMLVPLSLKAAWFVFGEHAETVKMFMADKERFLAQHGWTPDSPNAQIFIRRMLDPEAAGAYGLSNVFGSIVAALTAMAGAIALGLALRAKRTPSSSRWAAAGCMMIAMAAGVYTTYLSRSKGAFAAMVMAFGIVAVWAAVRGKVVLAKPQAGARRWGVIVGLTGLLLIAGATGAIVARGYLSPPTATGGERSLFFRYQYFVGALRYAQTTPPEVVARGVGPAGFQAVYQRVKDPLNPEEVMSTHDTVIDYAVMLGVGGLAWSVLLLGWAWLAGRGVGAAMTVADPQLEDSSKPSAAGRGELLGAGLLTGAIFFTQYRVQIDMIMPSNAMVWLVCMVAYLICTTLLASKTGWLAKLGVPWVALSAFVGAMVVLVHGQIEMTFFNTGGSVLAWLIVAVAAGVGVSARREAGNETWNDEPRSGRAAVAVVLVIGFGATAAFAAFPMRKTIAVQAHLAAASADLRGGNHPGAIEHLRAATTIDPADADIWRSWSTVRWELSEVLRRQGQTQQANALIKESIASIDAVVSKSGPLPDEGKLVRGLADMLEMVETDEPQAQRLERAAVYRERISVINPYAIEERLRYAKLLDKAGRQAEAIKVYKQALKLNEDTYLDPAKQLGERERAAVEARVRELGGG